MRRRLLNSYELWFDIDREPVLIPSSDPTSEQVRKMLEAIREEPVWLQFVEDCREARDRAYRSGS